MGFERGVEERRWLMHITFSDFHALMRCVFFMSRAATQLVFHNGYRVLFHHSLPEMPDYSFISSIKLPVSAEWVFTS